MKTSKVTLWLQVENNSKFVRGKNRARQDIERFQLQHYGMKKIDDSKYELAFCYEDDAHLDKIVCDLLQEIHLQADLRNCFVETDVQEHGTDRSW